MKRPKSIAGKRIRMGDLKVAAITAAFLVVPAWDVLLCYSQAWYFGMTIFALARGCLWALLSFGIATRHATSWAAVGSAVLAFLVLVPVEQIYFMSVEFYTAIYVAALLRLIAAFALMVAIAAAKSFV